MLDKFLEYLEYERRLSVHTCIAYQRDIQDFIAFFENQQLTSISFKSIRGYVAHLSNSNYTNRSINRKISAIKSFYRFLFKISLIQADPTLALKHLKEDKKQQINFSKNELEALFNLPDFLVDTFHAKRDFLILELFYTTGIRRAELINIKLEDIDFSSANLKVLGKRAKYRFIPLLPAVLDKMKTYVYYREKQIKSNQVKQTSFFIRSKGTPLSDRFVYQLVNNYLSKVSVKKKRSPHMLRHSFATHMLDNEADLRSVQNLLGHSSLITTQIYTNTSIQKLKDVFKKTHPRALKKKE